MFKDSPKHCSHGGVLFFILVSVQLCICQVGIQLLLARRTHALEMSLTFYGSDTRFKCLRKHKASFKAGQQVHMEVTAIHFDKSKDVTSKVLLQKTKTQSSGEKKKNLRFRVYSYPKHKNEFHYKRLHFFFAFLD